MVKLNTVEAETGDELPILAKFEADEDWNEFYAPAEARKSLIAFTTWLLEELEALETVDPEGVSLYIVQAEGYPNVAILCDDDVETLIEDGAMILIKKNES
jgi:hypothetical protein